MEGPACGLGNLSVQTHSQIFNADGKESWFKTQATVISWKVSSSAIKKALKIGKAIDHKQQQQSVIIEFYKSEVHLLQEDTGVALVIPT